MYEQTVIYINKEDVLNNFLEAIERIKDTDNYIATFFGFYFDDSYMDIDLTDEWSSLDIIVDYIKHKDLKNLTLYYMSEHKSDCDYAYVADSRHRNLSINDVQWKLRSYLISDDCDPDILLMLNPTWYSDEFDSSAYNYDYKGDVNL